MIVALLYDFVGHIRNVSLKNTVARGRYELPHVMCLLMSLFFGFSRFYVNSDFILTSTKTTRGHPYKLFKRQCTSTVRS